MNSKLHTTTAQKTYPGTRKKSGTRSATGDEVCFIVLSTGKDMDDKPFWAYLAVPCEQFQAFLAVQAGGSYALEDYGTVLAYGLGAEPPEKIKAEMITTYNLRDDFEQTLEAVRVLFQDE